MDEQIEFKANPDHAVMMFWVTWNALGEALREVAELTGDPVHIERLRQRMLVLPNSKMVEEEEGAGFSNPAFTRHLRNFEPEALQSGIDAINAAVARIKFAD